MKPRLAVTNTPSEQLLARANKYLLETQQKELRKVILRAALQHYGVERFTDLRPDVAELIAKELRFPSLPLAQKPTTGLKNPQPFARNGMTDPEGSPLKRIPTQDRLSAQKAEMKRKAVVQFQTEEAHDQMGLLWTVMAAHRPDYVFAVIKQGRMDSDWVEGFHSNHRDKAHMILEPKAYMGTSHAVRQKVLEEVVGKSDNEVAIRIVKKED